jgi:hypothetical protein
MSNRYRQPAVVAAAAFALYYGIRQVDSECLKAGNCQASPICATVRPQTEMRHLEGTPMVWVVTSLCAFIYSFTVLAFLLMRPAKKCGGCGEDLPKIRMDISLCPKCGCKVDWQGRKVGPKPTAK